METKLETRATTIHFPMVTVELTLQEAKEIYDFLADRHASFLLTKLRNQLEHILDR